MQSFKAFKMLLFPAQLEYHQKPVVIVALQTVTLAGATEVTFFGYRVNSAA